MAEQGILLDHPRILFAVVASSFADIVEACPGDILNYAVIEFDETGVVKLRTPLRGFPITTRARGVPLWFVAQLLTEGKIWPFKCRTEVAVRIKDRILIDDLMEYLYSNLTEEVVIMMSSGLTKTVTLKDD